jgi:hypothetical protein
MGVSPLRYALVVPCPEAHHGLPEGHAGRPQREHAETARPLAGNGCPRLYAVVRPPDLQR